MVVGLFANPILATNVMGNDTLFSRSMTIIFTFVLGTLKSFFFSLEKGARRMKHCSKSTFDKGHSV